MSRPSQAALAALTEEITACRACAAALPLPPRPVVRLSREARVLIIGQAPGRRVHDTGIPWNDPSGHRLRAWMGVDDAGFYDSGRYAILPMGFCYPGRKAGGDAPPRRECAPLWHERARSLLPEVRLSLLIGQHAIRHYLGPDAPNTAEVVQDWPGALRRGYFPLPHPSPRNNIWLRRHPWFEDRIVPALRAAVAAAITD